MKSIIASIKKILKKNKKIYNFFLSVSVLSKFLYFKLFLIIFSIFPIEKNKVMIVSYYGKGYGDNGKYIANELLNKGNNYKVYWATNKAHRKSLPNRINYIKFNSIPYLYHLATSKFWINNTRFNYGITKRKEQYYIQTWHSSLRLKKIEKDAINDLNNQYIKACKNDAKMTDLMIAGCDFSYNIYHNSFWYDGKIEKCGTPRCDIFFNDKAKEQIKRKILNQYNIDKEKKIILYAPTFRKNNEKENTINFEQLNEIIKNKLKDNYTFLVRFHPISKLSIDNYENIINVTNFPDIQELICASDILITDYSGCCFDMMINQKPCILYVKDLDEYLSKERELYFDFNELPFPKVKTVEELINILTKFNSKEYNKNVAKFNNYIGLCEEGNASKKIVEIIKKVGETNEKI